MTVDDVDDCLNNPSLDSTSNHDFDCPHALEPSRPSLSLAPSFPTPSLLTSLCISFILLFVIVLLLLLLSLAEREVKGE